MKPTFKLLFSLAFFLGVFSSCVTCREFPGEDMDRTEECGFGDETGAVELPVESEESSNKRVSPAANRGVQLEQENVIPATNEVLAGTNSVESKESSKKNKKRRNEGKIGSKRQKIKEIKQALKEHKSKSGESGLMLVLLVILAIILPPLAVGIFEGITTRFWLVLILWIIGWVLFGWLFGSLGGIIGLCALAAIILALLIVLGVI